MATSNVGLRVDQLTTPAFLVDYAQVKANCNNMLETCNKMGVRLRAQTKTHKTIEGAELQTGGTKKCLVTSTLDESEFYADHGFDDILYGYPLIPFHMPRVTALTKRLEKFHVMVDSRLAVETLLETPPPSPKTWSVFLKVDCGNGRAGVWWEDEEGIELALSLSSASSRITFCGVYVHCGNTYHADDPKDVDVLRDENIERLLKFVERAKMRGVVCPTVGIGSTPSCRRPADTMKKLTELHPGNYAFLDVQQSTLGSCSLEDIACCVATRIIGHYPRRNQMLIDCGFTGLTKQGEGKMPSGYCVIKDHPNLKLCSMTQEIGFVETIKGKLDYAKYPVGTMLFLLPWHSCATAAMYPVYNVIQDGRVTAEWKPTRGW
ncbi:D-serine dehydratase-like [Macrobrachium rosenbergii]|uniref:D-serine dehydratase-like n=1 Tax=Macrobrachium rosenbergii TaxID=79674 RepID=UPI0034D51BC0